MTRPTRRSYYGEDKTEHSPDPVRPIHHSRFISRKCTQRHCDHLDGLKHVRSGPDERKIERDHVDRLLRGRLSRPGTHGYWEVDGQSPEEAWAILIKFKTFEILVQSPPGQTITGTADRLGNLDLAIILETCLEGASDGPFVDCLSSTATCWPRGFARFRWMLRGTTVQPAASSPQSRRPSPPLPPPPPPPPPPQGSGLLLAPAAAAAAAEPRRHRSLKQRIRESKPMLQLHATQPQLLPAQHQQQHQQPPQTSYSDRRRSLRDRASLFLNRRPHSTSSYQDINIESLNFADLDSFPTHTSDGVITDQTLTEDLETAEPVGGEPLMGEVFVGPSLLDMVRADIMF
ncbi:hypothetical protein VPNG_00694 [Cytospora leucostoma]|uniref:Uncharacterized protein n=1 Tax=Cytospora leucostoma TaxID=1230097 RepID=A0A423XM57_9PEZI|nr:hypothetical protein VPNG_00694 [Cytospora leucostoma]